MTSYVINDENDLFLIDLSVYNGEINNELRIGELNFFIDGQGWLFGDIND